MHLPMAILAGKTGICMSHEFRLPDGMTVAERLLSLQSRSNKPFTQSLHPGIDNILGLRVPDVRALAKEIARGDWRSYLAAPGHHYMEERMLHGLVLGQIKVADAAEYLTLVEQFIPQINSWSVCDTFQFAGRQRFVNANRALVLDMLMRHLHSPHEYAVRFAVVMLMQHFITPESADRFIDLMESVNHPGYYVRMAVAWAISVAFVKASDTVYARLLHSPLDTFTFNKSLSKILESYRVSPADKLRVRSLRRPR